MFWNEDRTDTDLREAFYARPGDCQVRIHDKVADGSFTVLDHEPQLIIFRTTEPTAGAFAFGSLPL